MHDHRDQIETDPGGDQPRAEVSAVAQRDQHEDGGGGKKNSAPGNAGRAVECKRSDSYLLKREERDGDDQPRAFGKCTRASARGGSAGVVTGRLRQSADAGLPGLDRGGASEDDDGECSDGEQSGDEAGHG